MDAHVTDELHVTARRRRGAFLIPCGIAAVVVAGLALRVHPMDEKHPGYEKLDDHHKYVFMAENGPFSFHVAPFCWRPGMPALVRALPFDTQTGFRILTVASLWGTAVAFFYLARAVECGVATALFAVLTFLSTGWATKYPLLDFWLPDAAALLLVTLVVLCAFTNRFALGTVLLVVGVLFKESVLFAGLLFLTVPLPAASWRRRLLKGAVLLAPAAATLLALRLAIPARNDDAAYLRGLPQRLTEVDRGRASYDYAEQVKRVAGDRWRDVSLNTLESIHSYTVGSFGVLPVCLALAAPRRNLRLLARTSPFIALTYLQLLVATDTQRLLVLATPIVILMALNGLEVLLGRWRLSAVGMLLLPVAVIVLNLWEADRIAGPSKIEGAITVALMLSLWLIRFWRPPAGEDTPAKIAC